MAGRGVAGNDALLTTQASSTAGRNRVKVALPMGSHSLYRSGLDGPLADALQQSREIDARRPGGLRQQAGGSHARQ